MKEYLNLKLSDGFILNIDIRTILGSIAYDSNGGRATATAVLKMIQECQGNFVAAVEVSNGLQSTAS